MFHLTRRVGMVLGVILSALSAGCAQETGSHRPHDSAISGNLPTWTTSLERPQPQAKGPVQQVSASGGANGEPRIVREPQPINPEQPPDKKQSVEDRFGGATTLSITRLIDLVLERNPTLDQMRATAVAAKSRFPQAVSLDDPTLNVTTAPGSAWSNNATLAVRAEFAQKIPFSGKRELRGQVALAEANAAAREVDDTRLQLIESAMNAYADYSFTAQALVVNKENLDTLEKIRTDAVTRYKNLFAPQQDVLQAEVEIARQQERGVTLERMSRIAKARLNTLIHLPPDSILPPPDKIPAIAAPVNAIELRARAIAARPDLKTLGDRIVAEEASLALALREYKPDVELMAAYDGFWQGTGGPPLQWQIGAKINLPVRTSRRDAAVAEARARIAQRRAELSRLTDQINLQVQESYELLQESEKIILLYEKTLLPVAKANVKEARTSYVNGKVPFLSLAEAQRSLVTLKERYFEALADAVRRRASLERAIGGTIEKPQ